MAISSMSDQLVVKSNNVDVEAALADGLGQPVTIESIDTLRVDRASNSNIEISAEVVLNYEAGYKIIATVMLYLADFKCAPGSLEAAQAIQNKFNDIYCDEAMAFMATEQQLNEPLLELIKAHNTDDLALAVLLNLKTENSPYGAQLVSQFKERFVTLASEALAGQQLEPTQ